MAAAVLQAVLGSHATHIRRNISLPTCNLLPPPHPTHAGQVCIFHPPSNPHKDNSIYMAEAPCKHAC